MERLTTVLLVFASVLIGIIIGQASIPPTVVTVTPSAASANTVSNTNPADKKLTPYERGQLLADCYQAAPSGQIVLHCVENINKLP